MSYNQNCYNCPYNNQIHLAKTPYITTRNTPPIELEDNQSDILLVFQAPGSEEWKVGFAIQPTVKPGGTAGSRLLQSWNRKSKSRSDFDIINTVQCFPGNTGNRDTAPNVMAICCCSKRLLLVLQSKSYRKIITFGDLAFQVVSNLILSCSHQPQLIQARHPNGGVSQKILDSLW